MATMYDTILSLPFFFGLDRDAVSQFVEKVPIRFDTYSDGDKIIEKGEICSGLRFVLSGAVRVRLANADGTFGISYAMPARTVLGAEYLYGMERHFPYDASAIGEVSVMQVTKEDFAWLMRSYEICGINYFNYLSRRSQRQLEGLRLIGSGCPERVVAQIVSQFTEPKAEDICIECDPSQLAKLTGFPLKQIHQSEEAMTRQGIARRQESGLCIPSRCTILPV